MRHCPDLVGEDLACRRGERMVFAGLSFRLAPSGALVLTGANGSGNTILLRLLAGLICLTAGRLAQEDADCRAISPSVVPASVKTRNIRFRSPLPQFSDIVP